MISDALFFKRNVALLFCGWIREHVCSEANGFGRS